MYKLDTVMMKYRVHRNAQRPIVSCMLIYERVTYLLHCALYQYPQRLVVL